MKCSIQGCPGQVVHTVHRDSEILVFEHVPAEVCSVCGDTVLAPETVKRLEALLHGKGKPERLAPLYDYA